MNLIDEQLKLKAGLSLQVAKHYTNAWAVVRDQLEKDNNLVTLANVVNSVLEHMKVHQCSWNEAVTNIAINLETEGAKLLVMAAGVEICLKGFEPGQTVSLGAIMETTNS